jgi:hypothetical protein
VACRPLVIDLGDCIKDALSSAFNVDLFTAPPPRSEAAIEALETWQQRKQDTERRLSSTEELF